MSKFINRFYAGAIFSMCNGEYFKFKDVVIADDGDCFIIYESKSSDTIIIYKASIIEIILHPEEKRRVKECEENTNII